MESIHYLHGSLSSFFSLDLLAAGQRSRAKVRGRIEHRKAASKTRSIYSTERNINISTTEPRTYWGEGQLYIEVKVIYTLILRWIVQRRERCLDEVDRTTHLRRHDAWSMELSNRKLMVHALNKTGITDSVFQTGNFTDIQIWNFIRICSPKKISFFNKNNRRIFRLCFQIRPHYAQVWLPFGDITNSFCLKSHEMRISATSTILATSMTSAK